MRSPVLAPGRRFARSVQGRAKAVLARLLGRDAARAAFDAEMRRLVGPLPWCLDDVRIIDDHLVGAGWAIAGGIDPQTLDICVDGLPAHGLERGLERPDVAFYYWFLPGADRSGFRFAHPFTKAPATHWTIEYVDRATGRPIDAWHTFYVPADVREPGPLPSLPQIQRVHGGNSQTQYLIEGYSTYVKFDRALRGVAGHGFASCARILDFGCGCGRLARYLGDRPTLVGTDIDRDNVEWCRAHLPGTFLVNAPTPPLGVPPGQIDCVVANDVFPHLGEADSRAWLLEIARVCRQDAIVLVSIASDRSLARARLTAERYAEIRTLEFIDLSHNSDLDGVLEIPTSYRNVFHAHAYVRARWPDAGFEILDLIPGVSANQQDLVVMRRQ